MSSINSVQSSTIKWLSCVRGKHGKLNVTESFQDVYLQSLLFCTNKYMNR